MVLKICYFNWITFNATFSNKIIHVKILNEIFYIRKYVKLKFKIKSLTSDMGVGLKNIKKYVTVQIQIIRNFLLIYIVTASVSWRYMVMHPTNGSPMGLIRIIELSSNILYFRITMLYQTNTIFRLNSVEPLQSAMSKYKNGGGICQRILTLLNPRTR